MKNRSAEFFMLYFFVFFALFKCNQPTPPHGYLEASLLQNALQGDFVSARDAIKKGASPNIRTPDSEPLISYAIKSGNVDFALFLLNHGASGNKTGDLYSAPPFFYALKANNLMLTTKILEEYPESLFLMPNPDEFTSYGNRGNIPENHWPLIQTTHDNYKDAYQDWMSIGLAIEKDDIQQFKKLISDKPEIFNKFNFNGKTLLVELVLLEKIEFLDYAISLGVDINSRTARGTTPIIEAYDSEKKKSFNFLLKGGASINIPNEHFDTLLHIAALKKDYTTTEKLLKLGAEPNRYNLLQTTPLSIAISLREHKIEAALRKHGAVDFPWPALSPSFNP